VWNTFDAHRLLHWAGEQGAAAQLALKKALLRAYFGQGRGLADAQVLLQAVEESGLDVAQARSILQGDTYAAQVREEEAFYTSHGIHAVPSVIVNDRHLIQGGQPPEVFAQALRQIAAEAPAAA
jgi:predicted DsbA family dithiol-disulfide isomerase